MILSGNIFKDLLIVFWGGVLVSFTPCVYPLIPITASTIAGVNTTGGKLRGFFISLVYVLGLAVTYCGLGVFAALSGKIFGQWQNQPIVFLFVGNILIIFALALLDVIPLPALGINVQHKVRLKNIWGVFLIGITSGFIVGPCTAPVLSSVLLYVGAKQNVPYGVLLLFLFSLGVGTSLIIVGTFSGLLSNLPKSGPWLVGVKRFCAVVLLLAGEYFIIQAGRLWL